MLTLKPDDIFDDHYKLVRLVDTGGFAEVWEAVFIKAGNTVALKVFPRLDADGVKNIEAEFRNQIDLLHGNLVTARSFGVYQGQPYLEMLFLTGGNAGGKVGKCDEAEIARCLQQIGNGLTYLHAKEIIHQDIKPNNFLLDSDGNYYLADLGLSVKIRQTIQRYTAVKGTEGSAIPKNTTGLTPPCYRAPELYMNPSVPRPPLKATDIWSLGASIFEMATGEVPFGDMGGMLQMNNQEPPDLPSLFSAELNAIVKKCLAKNTTDRPKAVDLVEWSGNYIKKGFWAVPVSKEQQTAISSVPTKPGKKKMLYFLATFIVLASIAGIMMMNKGTTVRGIPEAGGKRTDTISSSNLVASIDSDKDGVPDSSDKCKDTPGNTRVDAGGCPVRANVSPPVPSNRVVAKPGKRIPEKKKSEKLDWMERDKEQKNQ